VDEPGDEEAPGALVYTAEEAAPMIKVTAYWMKARARRGYIPFTRIGRQYLWTPEQIREIVSAGEHRPLEPSLPRRPAAPVRSPTRAPEAPPPVLRARVPRRKREAGRHEER
jgi:hypothetical protein